MSGAIDLSSAREGVLGREVRFHKIGDPSVLQVDAVKYGAPAPQEVRLRQIAIGVNFHDILQRRGVLPPEQLPSGLGLEAAGIVEAIGEDVVDLNVGDAVAYTSGPVGAYGTHRVIDARHLVRIPSGMNGRTAAAVMMRGLTAQCLVERTYRVSAQDTVLVHAAAGGVGLILSQWARAIGATVIGTVGNERKADIAAAHGCHHIVLYRQENVAKRVRDLTNGKGVNVVYDGIGKDTFEPSLECLAMRGMLVCFGMSSGPPPPLDISKLGQKGSLYVTRFRMSHYLSTRAELEAGAERLFGMVTSGKVRPLIGQEFSLSDATKAHEALESGKTLGSTILVP